ncbi:MAG: hypothetical protein U0Q11_02660 [Vicinamibacterales bacterium]
MSHSVRVTLVCPVIGLLIGAGIGLQWPGLPPWLLMALTCGWTVCGLHAWRVRHAEVFAVCVGGTCAVAGVALCERAWQQAWRPTVRLVFEEAARDARREALRTGRVLPEDDSASMVVVGTLRSDGMVGPSGSASLAIDTEWMGRVAHAGSSADAASNPVEGGVTLTVVGALAEEHEAEWRAGRPYSRDRRTATTRAISRPRRAGSGTAARQARDVARRRGEERGARRGRDAGLPG